MRKIYKTQAQAERGETIWHNGAEHPVKVKLYGTNGPLKPLTLQPREEISLDSGYDVNIKGICPQLVRGHAPPVQKPPPPAKLVEETPATTPEPAGAKASADKPKAKAPAKD